MVRGGAMFGADRVWENKVFNRLDTSPLLTPDGRRRTLYLRIETVNICNNLCVVCAYRDQTRVKSTMSMATYRKALEDYREMGGGYVSITPLVGDVLLDRHLKERIEVIRKAEWVTGVGMTTNAAMAHRFDDSELEDIVSSFEWISISIYGCDQEEYEIMTKRRTYKQLLNGIRRICTYARNPVSLEFRLLKKRPREELDRWLREEVFEAEPTNCFVNSTLLKYANWSIYSAENNPLPFNAQWAPEEPKDHKAQCLIPIFGFMVFSNGNVSFCPCDNFDDVEELRLGNINEQSLIDIYNSDKVQRLWDWKKHGIPEFCKRCTFYAPLKKLARKPGLLTNPHTYVGAG